MKIEIEVIPTANPKAFNIGEGLFVGRAEVKRELRRLADDGIDATVAALFPAKAAPEPPAAQ